MIGRAVSYHRILDKLGEGGMGVVCKVEDIELQRTLALKFLPLRLTAPLIHNNEREAPWQSQNG
jgi:serine/threonine protein kinase